MTNKITMWVRSYQRSQYDPQLETWPHVYEEWREGPWDYDASTPIDLLEYRAPTLEDLDVDRLASDVWDWIEDEMHCHDELCWSHGWPVLPLSSDVDAAADIQPAWLELRSAIARMLREHLDLSEAAWQPTGRVRRIHPDGTWTEVDQ